MMRRISIWLAAGAAASITAIVVGPLLFAVWQGLAASSDEMAHSRDAKRLVSAYRDRLPSMVLLLTIAMPLDGEECGYSRETLFDAKDDVISYFGTPWTPYAGYDALLGWKNRQSDADYIDVMAEYLSRRTSPFSAAFLRQCMSGTVFGHWCEQHVRSLINGEGSTIGAPPERIFQSPLRERTICTYLDGLAARNGKPLAKR